MKSLILLAAATLSSPALAQHGGQGASASGQSPAATCTPEHAAMGHCIMPVPAPQPPAATCTPEHAAMGHCTIAPPAPVTAPEAVCTPEHAAMGHCRMPAVPAEPQVGQADPHAGHDADPHAGHGADPQEGHAADPHAGHHHPEPDPHAGHDHHQEPDPHAAHRHDEHDGHDGPGAEMRNPPRPPIAQPPPDAFGGPAHAADAVFGAETMAPVRDHIRREHGGMPHHMFLIDRAEARFGPHRGYAWEGHFWWGGDIDKLWLKSKGEGEFDGVIEHAEVQALWSRAIDPWFDLQLGLRHDFRAGPQTSHQVAAEQRTHAVLGVRGLAPYWFEVEGMLFLSTKGELTARFEAEYDLRITQRLVLQPSLELDFSLQDIPEIGVGAGLSTTEFGARLRYEIQPNLAPYVGLHFERAFGRTADFARQAGGKTEGLSFVAGIRTWF
jgi:copper resistance protein B